MQPRLLLDRLHTRLRENPLAWRLVVGSRVLLAAGFIPTGLVKALGQPFTTMTPDSNLGLFFHAMHQTGLYWRFLGASQMLAGVLLLIPATATLGAFLFLPILVNIFVITVSMDFHGTPVVTGMMVLANLLLVAWDWERWRAILPGPLASTAYEPPAPLTLTRAETACYVVGGATGMVFFLATRGLAPMTAARFALPIALLAVLAAVGLGLRESFRVWRARRLESVSA